MDSMYLDNLEEFVYDERRIVTYKWLSLTLQLHVNVAKQMLYEFVQRQKDAEGRQLEVTYLVSGVLCQGDKNLHKVLVVREENLQKIKIKFKTILSVHVYSVQDCRLPDLHSLYAADYDKVKEDFTQPVRFSGIHCPSVCLRSDADQKVPVDCKPVCSSPPAQKTEPVEGKTANRENVKKDAKLTTRTMKGPLASMFASVSKKQEIVSQSDAKAQPVAKKSAQANGVCKNKGTLFSFLSSSSGGKAASPMDRTHVSKTAGPPDADCTEDQDGDDRGRDLGARSSKMETVTRTNGSGKANKKGTSPSKAKKASRCKSRQKGKSRASPNKRRRIVMEDSDSSEGSEEDEEEPVPLSPPPPQASLQSDEEEVIPSTPQETKTPDGVPKGKKRKLVDKSFLDGEFLVTNKVYELVSDSDSENPLPASPPVKKSSASPKKKAARNSPKRLVQNQKCFTSPRKSKFSVTKSKQTSIMNFCKKK